MLSMLARNWWTLTVRGALGVCFGVLAFAWPGITLAWLVLFFGAYALFDGIFALVTALVSRHQTERWVPLLIEGLAGIAAGVLTFMWPGLTAFVLVYLIAGWAIVTGFFEIAAAVRLRKVVEGELMLGIAGALSIVFGVLMMIWPGAGVLAFIWLLGGYALVFGVLLIALSLRLRSLRMTDARHVPA